MSTKKSKRTADSELNKDIYEQQQGEEENEENGDEGHRRDDDDGDGNHGEGWQVADEKKLAKREIVAVRRKKPQSGGFKFAEPSESKQAEATTKSSSSSTSTTTSSSSTSSTSDLDPAAPAPTTAAPAPTTAAPALAPSLARFLQKPPGTWSCPTCDVDNKPELTKCRACETPNPNPAKTEDKPKETEKKDEKGTGKEEKETNGASTSQFSFGVSPSSASVPSFSFGVTAPVFSFSSDSSTPSFSFNNNHVSFSSLTQSTFAFGNASSTTSDEAAGGDEESASFQETVSAHAHEFKDKSAEKTGEEEDEVMHKARARVFALKKFKRVKGSKLPHDENEDAASSSTSTDDANKPEEEEVEDWKECGVGELHVNKYKIGEKSGIRLVMRTEKTKKLVLNSPVTSATVPMLQGEKTIKIPLIDLDGKVTVYGIQLKTKAEATSVIETIQKLVK